MWQKLKTELIKDAKRLGGQRGEGWQDEDGRGAGGGGGGEVGRGEDKEEI